MSGIMMGRVTLGQVGSGRVMVDLNAIGFRVQNGWLNRVSGSKRAVGSGPLGQIIIRRVILVFESYQIWVYDHFYCNNECII